MQRYPTSSLYRIYSFSIRASSLTLMLVLPADAKLKPVRLYARYGDTIDGRIQCTTHHMRLISQPNDNDDDLLILDCDSV